MWFICLWWARILYFFHVLPNGNWGPEYFAISWYSKFNWKRSGELAEEFFPGSTQDSGWHYEDENGPSP